MKNNLFLIQIHLICPYNYQNYYLILNSKHLKFLLYYLFQKLLKTILKFISLNVIYRYFDYHMFTNVVLIILFLLRKKLL